MRKWKYVPVIVCIMCLAGCASTGNSMLNSVNAMGYSDDPVNIEFAKKIWNGPVKVTSVMQDVPYLGAYNIQDLNSLTLYIPENLEGDAEYTVEVATVLSYYAEIYRQVQAKEPVSVDKAAAHMKKSYELMINNYLIKNKYTPVNPRHFKELINSITVNDTDLTTYYFNGKAVIQNGAVTSYNIK